MSGQIKTPTALSYMWFSSTGLAEDIFPTGIRTPFPESSNVYLSAPGGLVQFLWWGNLLLKLPL